VQNRFHGATQFSRAWLVAMIARCPMTTWQPSEPGRLYPLCDDCWVTWSASVHGRALEPIRFDDRSAETCPACGVSTNSGIYVGVRA
jgi:hypothetical protein